MFEKMCISVFEDYSVHNTFSDDHTARNSHWPMAPGRDPEEQQFLFLHRSDGGTPIDSISPGALSLFVCLLVLWVRYNHPRT